MSRTILVTGASGIVGHELVRTLVRSPDRPRLRLLLRGSPREVTAKLAHVRHWSGISDAGDPAIEAVAGDVTLPELGLADDCAARLRGELTDIIHCAAVTGFKQSPGDAARNNVDGTRHAIELARRCRKVPRFGLVSTAFVAGRRSGVVTEDELVPDAAFCTEYERSKAQAEFLARAASADLPLAIFRLSIVVGRRSDGHISQFAGPYQIWRLAHEGLLAMIPGDLLQPVDLIPADFAAEAMAWLMADGFRPGTTYHVCAGPDLSLALGEVMPAVMECLGRLDPTWRRRGYPMPITTSFEVFESFTRTVDAVGHRRLRAIVQSVQTFTRQLEAPKSFGTSNLDRDLQGSGIPLPHAREWLPTLVQHAWSCGWAASAQRPPVYVDPARLTTQLTYRQEQV